MAQDVGILISQPGSNVNTATGAAVLMNTRVPFIKLDTQNPVAFQSILLIITTDPTGPVGPSFADTFTILHKFRHGYAYVPTVETLFYVSSPAPGQTSASYQLYFYDYGTLAGSTAGIFGGAELYCIADATWVYYICRKYNLDGVSPTLLTGANVQISSHIFVDDIGV